MDVVFTALGLFGAWKLGKALAGTAPMRGAAMSTAERIERVVTLHGRATYLYAPKGATRILIYFHGFGDNVITSGPKLAKLVDPSMALVMPQLGSKSEPGNLDGVGANAWLQQVAAALRLPNSAPIYGVAHSGGYRALARVLTRLDVQGAALLDAFYGEYDAFFAFAHTGRCLIDLYGPGTATLSEKLAAATAGLHNVQVVPTTTFHPTIPEVHLKAVSRALVSCLPVVTKAEK